MHRQLTYSLPNTLQKVAQELMSTGRAAVIERAESYEMITLLRKRCLELENDLLRAHDENRELKVAMVAAAER